jgi:hypothetical protein
MNYGCGCCLSGRSVKLGPPPDVAADAHMLEVWHKSHHILPAIAFDRRYWCTLLLPLRTQKVRRDVETLKQIIMRENEPTQVHIVKLAESECGFTHGRTKTLLHMRRGLEWDWCFTDKPSGRYCFFGVQNSSLTLVIPREVPIEYLVAELERHTFQFYLPEKHNISCTWSSSLPFSEIKAWLRDRRPEIADYIHKRDGINACPSDKLVWEPPRRED